jgi:hypothetical protein
VERSGVSEADRSGLMKDARWNDVLESLRISKRHFDLAADMFAEGRVRSSNEEGYESVLAFLHAMQTGHGAFEDALMRTLDILEEQPPTGADWHALLLQRCARELPGKRPPIFGVELLAAAQETRGFRHIAMHVYDFTFDAQKAGRAVEAAKVLSANAVARIMEFGSRMDPDEEPEPSDNPQP